MGTAVVNKDKCFAWKQEDPSCDYCHIRCPFPDTAIKMVKGGGPVVVKDKCIGCGLCEYFCVPRDKAITILPARAAK
jgi:Pyruvate/2-oxoacid:ferredoxin oxidoreductase delta subunit